MKFDKFYILFVVFGLSKTQGLGSDEQKRLDDGFAKLGIDGDQCIKGSVIVDQNDPAETTEKFEAFYATDPYRQLACSTGKPKCGTQTKMISWPGRKRQTMELSFGCYAAKELTDRVMGITTHSFAIPMDGAKQIYENWSQEMPFIQEYFEKFKPLENDPIKERHAHENKWVENLSNDVFSSLEKGSKSLGGFGVDMKMEHENVTPLMLFYIVFICVSVVVRLIWLMKISYKSMKQDYKPVDQQEVESVLKTVEEME